MKLDLCRTLLPFTIRMVALVPEYQGHTHLYGTSIPFLCQPLSFFQSPSASLQHHGWGLGRPPVLIRESVIMSSAQSLTAHKKKHGMIKTHTDIQHGVDQPGRSLCLWVMSVDKIEQEQNLPPDTYPQLTSTPSASPALSDRSGVRTGGKELSGGGRIRLDRSGSTLG